jgi:hypothetical protein
MSSRKIPILIAVILTITLLLLGLIVFTRYISYGPTIEIRNESNYYTVSYKETPLFKNTIANWEIMPTKIFGNFNRASKKGIKKIIIIITDTPQNQYKATELGKPNNLLTTSKSEITKDHYLITHVQLRKDMQNANRALLFAVLNTVYPTANPDKNTTQYGRDIKEASKAFYTYTEQNPFQVIAK